MSTASEPGSSGADTGVSRRTAVRVGSGGILALVIGGVAGWVDRRGDDPAPVGPIDLAVATPTTTGVSTTTPAPVVVPEIGEIDPGIIALGRRVLETTGETDLESLVAALPDGEGDPVERAARFVRDDFLAGRTVTVDGWVLAVSEARAAAVIAMWCDEAAC